MDPVQYKLNISPVLYNALRAIAEEKDITVAEILRRGIKWELLVDSVNKNGGRIMIAKEKDSQLVEVLPF